MEKVRFGIVGCGNMGTGHSNNFMEGKIENGVLTAVCDINPDKLTAIKNKFGEKFKNVHCYATAEEMFSSGDVDVVMICVPHYFHPELAISAMDHHLHCIVEKPAGVYTKQVKEMLERAKTADTIVGIMFNQRTNPYFKKMREMIVGGEIGEIRRTNWIITNWYRTQSYYDSGSWRATWSGEGGGVLLNQAPHQLDLFQWITNMSPVKVRAFCRFGQWHDIEVEDDVTCYCEYANGASGVFITTTADAPGTNRFEVTGTLGKLVYTEDADYQVSLEYTKLDMDVRDQCFATQEGFRRPPMQKPVVIKLDEPNPQHVGICNNVANTVLGLETLYAPASDGLKGVQLANAMLLSTFLDKEVTLPIDDDLYWEELQKRIAVSKPHRVVHEKTTAQ